MTAKSRCSISARGLCENEDLVLQNYAIPEHPQELEWTLFKVHTGKVMYELKQYPAWQCPHRSQETISRKSWGTGLEYTVSLRRQSRQAAVVDQVDASGLAAATSEHSCSTLRETLFLLLLPCLSRLHVLLRSQPILEFTSESYASKSMPLFVRVPWPFKFIERLLHQRHSDSLAQPFWVHFDPYEARLLVVLIPCIYGFGLFAFHLAIKPQHASQDSVGIVVSQLIDIPPLVHVESRHIFKMFAVDPPLFLPK